VPANFFCRYSDKIMYPGWIWENNILNNFFRQICTELITIPNYKGGYLLKPG